MIAMLRILLASICWYCPVEKMLSKANDEHKGPRTKAQTKKRAFNAETRYRRWSVGRRVDTLETESHPETCGSAAAQCGKAAPFRAPGDFFNYLHPEAEPQDGAGRNGG